MLNQILRPIARSTFRRGQQQARLDHHGHVDKRVTFDEATVPQGSWQENYDKKNKKYTVHMIAGISIFVGTIVAVNQLELLYFNAVPPRPKQE